MKDVITILNRLLGRTYAAVQTNKNEKTENASTTPTPRNVALEILNKRFKCVLILAFVGSVMLGTGLSVFFCQPYDLLFKLKSVFADGGEIFEMWRTPPVELYLRVWLFNVTNKEAFLSGKEKLKVQEVGPYVYRELMSHENVTFNSNGTVSAAPSHPLVWVPELSEGHSEDDQLILPHIALLSIAHVVSSASFVTRFGLNVVIRQSESEPLVQMSAREFMFGYESTLMSLGYKFLPNWISFNKLGLIDRMYDFDGDFETVFTGEHDVRKSGLLDTYRGSKNIPQWEGKCGNINNASDGTKFASHIKPNDTLIFFRKSMCRAYNLVPVNRTVVSGLNGIVYNFEKNATDNGKFRPENSCFCKEGNCMPPGLLDVHDCYYGFPIATSFPHFLDADPSVREHVEGSRPDPKKHRSYFTVQPESGLPLEVAARFQINMALGDLDSMANVGQFSHMVLPLLWTETRMYNLPSALQMRFNLYLNVLPIVQTACMYLFFVLSVVFFAASLFKYLRKIKRFGKQHRPAWIDEYVEVDLHRKLSYSYTPQKRESLTSKELEIYFNSLITPLNQELTYEEFQKLKEEDV